MSAHFSRPLSSVGAGAVGVSAPAHGAVHGAKRRQPMVLEAVGGVRQRTPDAWRKPVAMATAVLVMRRSRLDSGRSGGDVGDPDLSQGR